MSCPVESDLNRHLEQLDLQAREEKYAEENPSYYWFITTKKWDEHAYSEDEKNELIADEVQQTGTVDHTPAYPREIMKRALELGATAMILCHNHPSGDPKPSQADVDMTNAIIAAGEPFNIIIHDHIIVSRNGTSSFKSLGLI